MAASWRDRFHQKPAQEDTGGERTQKNGERERVRDVFPLFLLSTLVVDSTTIRETSSKHRLPFNWANFLLSEEKLHSYPLLYVPSSLVHLAFRGRVGWISERFP